MAALIFCKILMMKVAARSITIQGLICSSKPYPILYLKTFQYTTMLYIRKQGLQKFRLKLHIPLNYFIPD